MADTNRFIQFELGKELLTVDLETSAVHLYKQDPTLDHAKLIVAHEFPSMEDPNAKSVVRLFNPESVVWFSGVRREVEGMDEEQVDQLSMSLERSSGRLVKLILEDTAPDDIRARYEKITGQPAPESKPSNDEVVDELASRLRYGYFPATWANSDR